MRFQYLAVAPTLFSVYVTSIPRSQPAAVEDPSLPSDNSVVGFLNADIPSAPTRDDTKNLAFQTERVCPPAVPAKPGYPARPSRKPVCCLVWKYEPIKKGRECHWALSWETACWEYDMQCCVGLKEEGGSLVGDDCVPAEHQWYPPGPLPLDPPFHQNHAPPDSSHKKPASCKNPNL